MQRKLLSLSLAIVILFLAACGSAAQSTAESSAPQRWMTVVYTEGLVEAQENSGGEWQALNTGQRVAPGASLRTATGSLLHVEINDGSAFIAGPESLITVAQFSPELENTLTTLDLQQGAVFVVAMNSSMGKSGAFEIKTATLTLTITSPEVGGVARAWLGGTCPYAERLRGFRYCHHRKGQDPSRGRHPGWHAVGQWYDYPSGR